MQAHSSCTEHSRPAYHQRNVRCLARRANKYVTSRHPNRQHQGRSPLLGDPNPWISVPDPPQKGPRRPTDSEPLGPVRRRPRGAQVRPEDQAAAQNTAAYDAEDEGPGPDVPRAWIRVQKSGQADAFRDVTGSSERSHTDKEGSAKRPGALGSARRPSAITSAAASAPSRFPRRAEPTAWQPRTQEAPPHASDRPTHPPQPTTQQATGTQARTFRQQAESPSAPTHSPQHAEVSSEPGGIQRAQDNSTQGRYIQHISAVQPSTASEALSRASQLAALAGPYVGLKGPKRRRRIGPVQEQLYAGVFGQTQQPWWQWRQWLRSRRSQPQPAVAQDTPLHTLDSTHPTNQAPPSSQPSFSDATATRHTLPSGGADRVQPSLPAMPVRIGLHGAQPYVPNVQSLTALTMDDADLDLDSVEPGTTADMLQRRGGDMEAEVADHTWRQLRALAAAPPRGAAPAALRIFKGGGYILADLEAMLKVTGLEGVLRVQREIRGAQCILAMERCSNGKRVNLRQHQAASTRRRIPLVLTRSLRVRDVLLALRPVLMELGLVQDTNQRPEIQLTQDMAVPRLHKQTQLSDMTRTAASAHVGMDDNTWRSAQPGLLTALIEGRIRVADYIMRTQIR